jgi:hypothetical protein
LMPRVLSCFQTWLIIQDHRYFDCRRFFRRLFDFRSLKIFAITLTSCILKDSYALLALALSYLACIFA